MSSTLEKHAGVGDCPVAPIARVSNGPASCVVVCSVAGRLATTCSPIRLEGGHTSSRATTSWRGSNKALCG
jgi:hypothetical protein